MRRSRRSRAFAMRGPRWRKKIANMSIKRATSARSLPSHRHKLCARTPYFFWRPPSMAAPAASLQDVRSASVGWQPDWRRVAYLLHASRALDDIEESKLLPERQVLYQFCARGHDFAQI